MGSLRVVYIMGYGRSGSTLLDTLLGNQPGVVSTGELDFYAAAVSDPEAYCACQETVAACPFWGEVHSLWVARGFDLPRYTRVQRALERGPLAAARVSTRDRTSWGEMTAGLLEEIARVSGSSVVVDSSKLPRRGRLLAALPELDVFLLHLVRDGRGVAWSLNRSFKKDPRSGIPRDIAPRSVSRTALRWSAVNLSASLVRRRHRADRQCVVRYEDYTSDPAGALAPLLDFLEREGGSTLAPDEELQRGHTLAGNRLRMQRSTRIRRDLEWEEAMPQHDRDRFWRLAFPVMKSFGYAK